MYSLKAYGIPKGPVNAILSSSLLTCLQVKGEGTSQPGKHLMLQRSATAYSGISLHQCTAFAEYCDT